MACVELLPSIQMLPPAFISPVTILSPSTARSQTPGFDARVELSLASSEPLMRNRCTDAVVLVIDNNGVVAFGAAANVARVTLLVVSKILFAVNDPMFGDEGVLFPPTSQTGETPPDIVMIIPVPDGKVNVPPGLEPRSNELAPVFELS